MDKLENYRLGETDEVLDLTSSEETREISQTLVGQGRRSVLIFSRELDPLIYDTPSFVEALAALVTANSWASVRILIQEPEAVTRRGHRLLDVARRLSSFIQIYKTPQAIAQFNEAFLVVDESGLVHRKYGDRFEGQASFHAPRQARELTRWFNEVWGQSTSDIAFRRLHI